VALLLLLCAEVPTLAAIQESYKLAATGEPAPQDFRDAVRENLQEDGWRVFTPAGEPLMDLWFIRELPVAESPSTHPGIAYGAIPEGVVLAAMRLHKEHRDFRDQAVPAGSYVVRYLHQPDDGDHLGETTFRDFGVLVPAVTARTTAPQRFDVTLGQALSLNTHPFAWGLWPPNEVSTSSVPGLASFQADKWAIKLSLPRPNADPLSIAFVVVGNERVYH